MLHFAIRRYAVPAVLATVLAAAVGGVLAGVGLAGASQDVTAVRGSAFGYHADEIALFGGAQPDTGPTPSVALASNGSNSPQTASQPTGSVQYGPATIFSSGQIDVTTAGSLGPGGSVTSTADIDDVNTGGSEVFTAANLTGTCTASETGVSGATTVTGGTVRTHAQASDHDEGVVAIPANPPPNYTVEGHIHLGSSQDNFRIVFNEHVVNADGSLTVNAVHEYFLGPTLVGHLYLGQVVCGVTAIQGTTTTTAPGTTTTTAGGTTTTTMPGGTTTTTTTVPSDPALPDASIRRKGTPSWLGEDIVNTSGRNQIAKTRADGGDKRIFKIRIRNYGDATGTFEISGTGDVGRFVTRYFRGRREITRRVENGTYRLEGVVPGDAEVLRLVVKVRRSAPEGKVGLWRITASSGPDASDTVKARVKVT